MHKGIVCTLYFEEYDKNIFEYHLEPKVHFQNISTIIKFKFSGILIRKELVMKQNKYLGYPILNI